jgi:hypothetical protein
MGFRVSEVDRGRGFMAKYAYRSARLCEALQGKANLRTTAGLTIVILGWEFVYLE